MSTGLVPAAVLGAGGLVAGGSDVAAVVGAELTASDVTGDDEDVAGGLDGGGLAADDDVVGEAVVDEEADPEAEVDESVGVASAEVESPTTT